ncbi:MAG: mechanosensitive ion channel [Candidatus Magnetomorum sp.]|nr:mechanosensitive ion channel [Candidatus Magnetomorum sp.]
MIYAQVPGEAIQTQSQEKTLSLKITDDVAAKMAREAVNVGEQIQSKARSLFEHSPLGWDIHTIQSIYQWCLKLPLNIPVFMQYVLDQAQLLGVLGSLIIIIFIVAILYSLSGQERVFAHIEFALKPLKRKLPDVVYPYILSLITIIVASLIPLLLLGTFSLINAFINYQAPWFLLIGRLLGLWAVVVFVRKFLHESLLQNLLAIPHRYGQSIYRMSLLIIFYVAGALSIFWGAEAFQVSRDVLALLKFIISISIVCILVLLLRKKEALLSLLPDLPYSIYQGFIKYLKQYYFIAISFTLITGLLWCLGYKRFGIVIWTKTWAVAGFYVFMVIVYHLLMGWLNRWKKSKGPLTEEANFLSKTLHMVILYTSVITTTAISLKLFGIFEPLQRLMALPVMYISDTPLSIWTFFKVIFILLIFNYMSRMLRAYLDYKIYPTIGVDTGLAYALNTFLNYLLLGIGILFSMKIMGLDLRVLMVFAGAVGIGVGLGFQHIAANMVSGFTLIFGRHLRRGDWIEIEGQVGIIKEISLWATKIQTRDEVEYLIPNDTFITNTIVNYTLSSPMIRMSIPVGVSYNADPETVKKILTKAAIRHHEVTQFKPPEVFLGEYGDNSVNFDLMVWFDISKIGKRRLRSKLYYSIFSELKAAGIEIPFPQRDIHIRSGLRCDNRSRTL